jgi:raffinose/stachyose/melibiose transport system permease protein
MTMTSLSTETVARPPGHTREPAPVPRRSWRNPRGGERPNWLGLLVSLFWLAVVIIPIYWMVITSLKDQSSYFVTSSMKPPSHPSFDPYDTVLHSGFGRYFLNSVIVAVATVVPAVLLSFMAAFAIVRGSGRFLRCTSVVFLAGLALPLQAVVIPVYLIIIRLQLYDTLLAIILPSIAFAIPLSVLILANFIRDVPKELFESMRLDGASEWGTLWHLAFPLVRPALVTVSIYNGLTVWNGFILPLVLTQSPNQRTLPLALQAFQGQFQIDIPAVLASVVLATLPVIVLYVLGRRQLVSGLTAGFGK